METKDVVKASPLRISTKVITADFGTPMRLKELFERISSRIIPLWLPTEGILKMEHEQNILGQCVRDAFSKRHVSDKTFFNQSTIVVRKATNIEKTKFKEVNIKLFANGGVQMTGIPAEDFATETLEWLLNELVQIKPTFFEKDPVLGKFRVQLINSDYSIAYPVKRDTLHSILTRDYGLFSTFEGTIYQGVNTKYYYNEEHPDPSRPGICLCSKRCRGQGSGIGPGQCKRITMSIFQTGRIIITGARFMKQINEAYDFLNMVLQKHCDQVLRMNVVAEEPKSGKPRMRKTTAGKLK
jgi:TATA-box binding protein (TBP) (component of TFIID and TFIIIB)